MYPNLKPSDKVTQLGKISPVSQGVGSATSGWILVSEFAQILAEIVTGVLGAAATVDAKLQQATSNAGAGAKDITGAAITQLVKASNDNNTAFINLDVNKLDAANGFCYVQLSITVGAAASLIAGKVFGLGARHGVPAHDASVVEAVNVA